MSDMFQDSELSEYGQPSDAFHQRMPASHRTGPQERHSAAATRRVTGLLDGVGV